jgi:hypothetical protein
MISSGCDCSKVNQFLSNIEVVIKATAEQKALTAQIPLQIPYHRYLPEAYLLNDQEILFFKIRLKLLED